MLSPGIQAGQSILHLGRRWASELRGTGPDTNLLLGQSCFICHGSMYHLHGSDVYFAESRPVERSLESNREMIYDIHPHFLHQRLDDLVYPLVFLGYPLLFSVWVGRPWPIAPALSTAGHFGPYRVIFQHCPFPSISLSKW